MNWTPEKTAELHRLKSEGVSHSEIASRLGCETRSMVSSKLRREKTQTRVMGRPKSSKSEKRCDTWGQRVFAPYNQWKAERKAARSMTV